MVAASSAVPSRPLILAGRTRMGRASGRSPAFVDLAGAHVVPGLGDQLTKRSSARSMLAP